MQKYNLHNDGLHPDANGNWLMAADVAEHVDELNAELEASRLREARLQEMVNIAEQFPGYLLDHCEGETIYEESLQQWLGESIKMYAATPVPQPQVLPDPPSHEESYQNNLTQALRERDTLRDVLALLAPDLKAMAILYAQNGDHTRSQALANICKSVGVL